MQINITITNDTEKKTEKEGRSLVDMAKGAIGYMDKRPTRKNPMIDDDPQAKYEAGYDAPGWSGKFKDYTVKAGDTIESISKEHGCPAKEIVMLNRKNGNMLSDNVNEGQTIKIPIMD